MQAMTLHLPPKPRVRVRSRWHVVSAALLLGASHLHAHTFCISTSAALQQALTDSSDGGMYAGEDNALNLTINQTYQTGAAAFHYYSTSQQSLSIVGGFVGPTCASLVYSASRTVLDGHGTTAVLSLASADGSIGVSNLSIRGGESTSPGAGLQVNYLITAGIGFVNVDHVVVHNNHTSASAGGVYISAGSGALAFSGNVIVDNKADTQYGAGYISGYSHLAECRNNTVSRNISTASASPVGGLYLGGTASWGVGRSIFWNNTGPGLYLGNANSVLFDNDYGLLGGSAPQSEQNSVSVSPMFVNVAIGDFHLGTGSPLLGVVSPISGFDIDLEGNPLPKHKMDFGAYYETIFIDNFDGD